MMQLILKSVITSALIIPIIIPVGSVVYAATYNSCSELVPQWQDVSGKWIASVGPVILQVKGLHVTGIYNQDTWSLDLRYSEDRMHLSGRWSHRNGLEGPVIFHLDKTGCITHARWGGTGHAICNQNDSSACIHDWAFHGRARN